MWVILAVLAWPLTEIALFVVIGGQIGVWAVLAWVLVSAVLGVVVLRLAATQGTVRRNGGLSAQLRDPQALRGALGAGLLRGLGGMLLILPGFLTDAIGLVLLLPPVQAVISSAMLRRVTVVQAGRPAQGDVVEGEWEEMPPPDRARLDDGGQRPSGWTRD